MAKVHNNIFVRGLTGSVGDQFVIRKTRKGHTIIANKPTFDENRVFSVAQMAQQEAFRQASVYAKTAMSQSIYQEKAAQQDMSAYNAAMADWFGQPKVLDIDISNWTGEIGQTIGVKAKDDTKVISVQVSIQSPDGSTTLEEGQAVLSGTDGLLWAYTTTSGVSIQPGTRVVATAKDLPGNAEGMVWLMN